MDLLQVICIFGETWACNRWFVFLVKHLLVIGDLYSREIIGLLRVICILGETIACYRWFVFLVKHLLVICIGGLYTWWNICLLQVICILDETFAWYMWLLFLGQHLLVTGDLYSWRNAGTIQRWWYYTSIRFRWQNHERQRNISI